LGALERVILESQQKIFYSFSQKTDILKAFSTRYQVQKA
jgi:hypothetical protein